MYSIQVVRVATLDNSRICIRVFLENSHPAVKSVHTDVYLQRAASSGNFTRSEDGTKLALTKKAITKVVACKRALLENYTYRLERLPKGKGGNFTTNDWYWNKSLFDNNPYLKVAGLQTPQDFTSMYGQELVNPIKIKPPLKYEAILAEDSIVGTTPAPPEVYEEEENPDGNF